MKKKKDKSKYKKEEKSGEVGIYSYSELNN